MVSRVLFRARELLDGGCVGRGAIISLPGALPRRGVASPKRRHAAIYPFPLAGPAGNCVILHAVGFALPRSSPIGRCALTAPFHPCLIRARGPAIGGVFSVALSLARDRGAEAPCSGRWVLPTTVSCRARTFLPGMNPERSPHPQRRWMIGREAIEELRQRNSRGRRPLIAGQVPGRLPLRLQAAQGECGADTLSA